MSHEFHECPVAEIPDEHRLRKGPEWSQCVRCFTVFRTDALANAYVFDCEQERETLEQEGVI